MSTTAHFILFHQRKPRPLGVVRVQRLCQLNDSFDSPSLSCTYNFSRGIINEWISQAITKQLLMISPKVPVPSFVGTLKGRTAIRVFNLNCDIV